MKKLILASASPRRREIFTLLDLDFEIKPSSKEPPIKEGQSPFDAAFLSAKAKATDIFSKNSDAVVVGADTIVVLDSRILGKPKDENEAKSMLKSLSGKAHEVWTGVFVCSKDRQEGFVASTKVDFYELCDEEIEQYIKTGEPMDKAGSYGVQGRGLKFVKGIIGDYFNVVGFPAAEFMRKFGDLLK